MSPKIDFRLRQMSSSPCRLGVHKRGLRQWGACWEFRKEGTNIDGKSEENEGERIGRSSIHKGGVRYKRDPRHRFRVRNTPKNQVGGAMRKVRICTKGGL